MKQAKVIAFTAGALALTLSGCVGSGASPDTPPSAGESVEVSGNGTPLTLGLTYVPNVQFAPVYVAAEDSLFTNAGLGVSVRHHGSDEGLFSALTTGEEDVVIASGDEVLQARSQGLDLVSIASYYREYPVEIIVPAESPIKDIADLRGKKVGLPGEFGSNWFGLLAALDSAGMSRDDITLVPVGYTQAAALVGGDVDAIVGFSNSEPVQLQQMGFPTRSLQLPAEIPLIGASVITTQQWLDDNPFQAKQLVAALAAAMERISSNPTHALEVSAKWDDSLSDSNSRAGAKASLEATIPLWVDDAGTVDLSQDLERWDAMGAFLAEILDDPTLAEVSTGAAVNQPVGQ